MPQGPCDVTQHGEPMPLFGQNCALQVVPAPAVPPTEASGGEAPLPPNPLPPSPLPDAPPLPEAPPVPELPPTPAEPESPDAPKLPPPVPSTPPAPPETPESLFPFPDVVTSSSPEQAPTETPEASSTAQSVRAGDLMRSIRPPEWRLTCESHVTDRMMIA